MNVAKWTYDSPACCPSTQSIEELISTLYRFAMTWQDRGELAPAEVIYRLVIDLHDSSPGVKSSEALFSIINLAEMLSDAERYIDAEHMHLRAMSTCLERLGMMHPIFGLTLRNYASFLRQLNMTSEALNIEQRAREVFQSGCIDAFKQHLNEPRLLEGHNIEYMPLPVDSGKRNRLGA